MCFLSLDPQDTTCVCAVGFTFIIVIRAVALTAFMLCFVLYSLRVQICVLFPAIVEKAKISHQLSGHLCTYVNPFVKHKNRGKSLLHSVEHFR